MKKTLGVLASILPAGVWSTEAFAHSGSPYAFIHAVQHWWIEYFNSLNNSGNNGGQGYSVPELDGATGPLAITLIVAVIGIGLERNRRKKAKRVSNS